MQKFKYNSSGSQKKITHDETFYITQLDCQNSEIYPSVKFATAIFNQQSPDMYENCCPVIKGVSH